MKKVTKKFTLASLLTVCILFALPVNSQDDAGNTGYLGMITMPHGAESIGRPGAMFFDPARDELYLADVGHSRILLFNSAGSFSFEIVDPKHLQSPGSIVVDSTGRIWCTTAATQSGAAVFDYNGDFLREIDFRDKSGESISKITGMLITEDNKLLVLSTKPANLRYYSLEGELLDEFELFAGLSEATRKQDFFGQPALIDGKLVIPMPMTQTVGRFTMQGKLIDFFGISGGVPGRMSFPAAVCGDGGGNMIVLDKHRHVLMKYDSDGKWIEEFGGIGNVPGRLYHPTSLTGNGKGECFVAQTFEQRLQKFRVTRPSDLSFLTSDNQADHK